MRRGGPCARPHSAGDCGPQGGHKARPYKDEYLCRPFNEAAIKVPVPAHRGL